jgi:cytochrome c oxidase subunit III
MPQVLREKPAPGGPGGVRFPGGGFNGDGVPPSRGRPAASTALVGMGAFLAAVTMLFVAFTSAYLARQQESGWSVIAMPGILWVNTGVLLASSGALEWARSALRRDDALGVRRGLAITTSLGILFVLGQLLAWRNLAAQGVFLTSNPHSSFFYLLTGVHGLHLLGGLCALGVVLLRAWQGHYTAREHGGLTVFATYWHFMDALWVYLFVLLFWA